MNGRWRGLAGVACGALLIGDYAYGEKGGGAQVLLVANHNAYEPQTDVALVPEAGFKKISLFSREAGAWTVLPARGGEVTFTVPPAGIAMLKFEK